MSGDLGTTDIHQPSGSFNLFVSAEMSGTRSGRMAIVADEDRKR
jgi:hypothetical protein